MVTVAPDVISIAGPVDLPLTGERDVQAACGIMHVNGRSVGHPRPLGFDYVSIVANELAELGLAALKLAQARDVPLRMVSTSLAQAALLTVSQYLAAATADEAEESWAPGWPAFRSAERVRFEIEALDPLVWNHFWTELGADITDVSRGWRPFLHRFATATCPLPPGLHDLLAGQPITGIEDVGRRVGMTVVRVAEHAIDHVPPFELSGSTNRVPGRADGLLPLSGLVVVESCRRVQGPMAGHLLRLLGAEVIRVEPPGGDPLRWVPPIVEGTSARFRALNGGKRVVEIDLAEPVGRRQLLDLVADADVFLHNWAPGRAKRWSLRADDLARAQPDIVYAHASGWGAELGPNPPLGTDFAVQAYAGVPPSPMTMVDVFGGIVCAHGIVAALASGASHVGSSLLSAACRLNARSHTHCGAPLTVPVCDDLSVLAADQRFARALIHDGCALVASPWKFTS